MQGGSRCAAARNAVSSKLLCPVWKHDSGKEQGGRRNESTGCVVGLMVDSGSFPFRALLAKLPRYSGVGQLFCCAKRVSPRTLIFVFIKQSSPLPDIYFRLDGLLFSSCYFRQLSELMHLFIHPAECPSTLCPPSSSSVYPNGFSQPTSRTMVAQVVGSSRLQHLL